MTPKDIDRAFAPLRQYAADRLSGKLPPPDLAEIERNTRHFGDLDFPAGQTKFAVRFNPQTGRIISAEPCEGE